MSGNAAWLPFRATLHLTFAAKSLEDAEVVFEQLCGSAEHADFLIEVGSVEQMDAADVVPDSPLAKALTDA